MSSLECAQAVKNFLNERRVTESNLETTHLSYGGFNGKFYISDEDYNNFMDLYIKAINEGAELSILEKPKEYGPIIVDIDLQKETDNINERLYNKEMIKEIIKKYINAIDYYLDAPKNYFKISLFEKNKGTKKDNYIKDGFHLMFTNICTNSKIRHLIRNRVVKACKEDKLFEGFIQGPDDIIDKAVVSTNSWFLYGSRKPNGSLYTLTKMYDYDINVLYDHKKKKLYDPETGYYEDYENNNEILIKYFSIQQKCFRKKRETSLSDNSISIPSNEEIEEKLEEQIKEDEKDDLRTTIKKLLKLLKLERATDYEKWRNIGFIINNCLGKDGFDLFNEFSKQAKSKYNEQLVKDFYLKIKKKECGGLKIASLHTYAKEDNLEEYKKLFKKEKLTFEEIQEKNEESYRKVKNQFELNNFKLRHPMSYVEITEDKTLIMRKKTDFLNVYENLYYKKIFTEGYDEGGLLKTTIKDVSFVNAWLKDSDIRTYDCLDFRPLEENIPKRIYNTFSGYEADKRNLDDSIIDIKESLLYKHLFNICGNNNDVMNYTLNYLSSIIKQPYNKTRTALVIRSVEGAGKDMFFNWFGSNILGRRYYINDSNIKLLFGDFNASLQSKILCVLNETQATDTGPIIEKLKDAITKDYNSIIKKGFDAFEEGNYAHFIFLTNNTSPIPIKPKDRRFVLFDCNNEIANNNEYFTNLLNEIKSKKYDRAFYEHLKNRDIKDFDFTGQRPITKAYQNLISYNVPIYAQWLSNIVDDEDLLQQYSATDFFYMFKIWKDNQEFTGTITSAKFGLEIKDYLGIEKIRKNSGTFYIINKKQLKQFLIKNQYYEQLTFINE
jgi:hypothetical protein